MVVLYSSNPDSQDAYIQTALDKGYEVLLFDSPIASHFIQRMEHEKEKVKFSRVDADHIQNLIQKDEHIIARLSDEEKETLKTDIEKAIDNKSFTVKLEDLSLDDAPFVITLPEFMRRMKEMQQAGGNMFAMGDFPQMYNLIVNANSDLANEILKKPEDEKEALINQALDLRSEEHTSELQSRGHLVCR